MSIKEEGKRASDNLPHQRIIADKIWCPLCREHTKFMKIANAAKLVDVSQRTIFRYIDEGVVHSIRVAGKTRRLCSGCLLKSVE